MWRRESRDTTITPSEKIASPRTADFGSDAKSACDALKGTRGREQVLSIDKGKVSKRGIND